MEEVHNQCPYRNEDCPLCNHKNPNSVNLTQPMNKQDIMEKFDKWESMNGVHLIKDDEVRRLVYSFIQHAIAQERKDIVSKINTKIYDYLPAENMQFKLNNAEMEKLLDGISEIINNISKKLE